MIGHFEYWRSPFTSAWVSLVAVLAGITFITPLAAATLSSRQLKLSHENIRRGHWQLAVTRTEFSRGISCRLRSKGRDAFYSKGAVGFRQGASRDVSDAVYRIDQSPPRRFRDDIPELVTRQVPIDRGPIGNASAGIVWVPFETLSQAKSITIQPSPGKRAHVRHLDGLVELHDLAIAHGCAPESSFVE